MILDIYIFFKIFSEMQGIIEVEPKAYLDFEAEDNKLAHASLTIKNLT